MQYLKTGNDYSVYNANNNYLGMLFLIGNKEYWADLNNCNADELKEIYEKMTELNKSINNNG